ncbi:hypothetical protein KCU90_g13977, partial [Aureobasidium melanogenum]
SAIHKQLNGRLVLWWVTTGESLLLYVLFLESLVVGVFCIVIRAAKMSLTHDPSSRPNVRY